MPSFAQRLSVSAARTAAVLALLLAAILATASTAAAEPERVAGDNRVATAAEVSQRGWDDADRAVLASADDYPDALAAASLAAREGLPLLLTDPHQLSSDTSQELERLGVSAVTLLGGPSAVSEAVEAQVGELANAPDVDRIAGEDRYETAAAAAEGDADEVIVASGEDYPDAISAAGLSVGAGGSPVILTHPQHMLDETAAAIEASGASRVVIVGGSSAVGESLEGELEGIVDEVDRRYGSDRYATSAAVASLAMDRQDADTRPVLASGGSYTDALAGASFAAQDGGVLVLARPNQPHGPTDDFLREHTDAWGAPVVIGGSGALSDDAIAALARSVRDEEHPEPEPEPEPQQAASVPIGEQVVEHARSQLGTPYVWGGSSPSGFDCSGLTSWSWRQAGVSIPRTSSAQFSNLPRVPNGQQRPGDIVAFNHPVSHVGVYIGDGQMIEASRRGVPVRVASVNRSGFRGYVRPGG